MSQALRDSEREGAVSVATVDEPDQLVAFLAPDCAAALWRRTPLEGFQTWLDALPPALLPVGRVNLAISSVHGAVTALCESARTPIGAHRERLIDDIAALAELFGELMQVRYVQLRLEAVDSNACRKFHIDAVRARLVCTYRGTGTQYGFSTNGNEPSPIETAPTGSPLLLRGKRWAPVSNTRLHHRSPPIEGSGETRLVLVFDPLDHPDGET